MQDLKAKQLEAYKGMIAKYIKRGSDDAWVKKSLRLSTKQPKSKSNFAA